MTVEASSEREMWETGTEKGGMGDAKASKGVSVW